MSAFDSYYHLSSNSINASLFLDTPNTSQSTIKLSEQCRLTVPSQYLPISVAGAGRQGNVYFCLLRSNIPAKRPLTRAEIASLKTKIVAVKIAHRIELEAPIDLAREVAFLKKISTLAPSEQLTHFTTLLDYGPIELENGTDTCKWITVQAFQPSLHIGKFKDAFRKVGHTPNALIAHIFLQLGSALQFLHSRIDIAHCDLHDGNILLDTQYPSLNGFPNFVIIDFGFARPADEFHRSMDVEALCEVFHELMLLAKVDKDEDGKWTEFREVVRTVTSTSVADFELEELWVEYAGVVKEVLGQATADDIETVRRVVEVAVSDARKAMPDEDLIAALEAM